MRVGSLLACCKPGATMTMTMSYISTISLHVLHRLSQLEKLQVLNLSGNPLRKVPEAVYSLSQFTELNLAGCKLRNISDRYDNYAKLPILHKNMLLSCWSVFCSTLHSIITLHRNLITLSVSVGNELIS